MTILETVMGTLGTAVDTISTVTQTIVEKNRTNAKLNRLRMIMKSESELMNRAYIALGKLYYDGEKRGSGVSESDREKLFEVIENSKAKISKARECYRNIAVSQSDIFYGTPEAPEYKAEDIVDITVACSNESEYDSSPFKKTVTAYAAEEEITLAAAEDIEEAEEEAEKEETAEEAEPTNDTTVDDKLTSLKEELESKKKPADSFADTDEVDEAVDSESPEDELF